MVTANLARATARLSELLDKVEAGHEVVITRRGMAVAQLSAIGGSKKPLPVKQPAEFRSTTPRLRNSAVELLRELRDEGL